MNENDQGNKNNNETGFSFPILNRVTIAGKLVNDPPLRKTKRGVPVTNFIIKTSPEKTPDHSDDLERETCFISVVVWAQQAVQCNKYLKKGQCVLIVGELQSMPNANLKNEYFPVQVNAQWIQYLDRMNQNEDNHYNNEDLADNKSETNH